MHLSSVLFETAGEYSASGEEHSQLQHIDQKALHLSIALVLGFISKLPCISRCTWPVALRCRKSCMLARQAAD